jgi:hypothetical protein
MMHILVVSILPVCLEVEERANAAWQIMMFDVS